jgi:twitching motility protein PilT
MGTPDTPLVGWLTRAVETSASDLHVVVGHRPTLRVHGELEAIDDVVLTHKRASEALLPFCPERMREKFEHERNADFALQLEIAGRQERFRVNYFVNGENPGACFRWIQSEIPSFEWSAFPRELANRLAHFRNGLVLITGMTGAGKTTTLAMIINLLNKRAAIASSRLKTRLSTCFHPRAGPSSVNARWPAMWRRLPTDLNMACVRIRT